PIARIPSFGTETPLDFPFRAAAKTGTSRHFTDNWAVATTANFTVAGWVGNFNGRPMQGVGGITGAGPLLHRAVLLTARRYPPGDLPEPASAGPGWAPATRRWPCGPPAARAASAGSWPAGRLRESAGRSRPGATRFAPKRSAASAPRCGSTCAEDIFPAAVATPTEVRC